MLCVHQTVFIRVRAAQQVVCTLWAVVYSGGGVCSKQPGLSVCSESGAAGGPRCGTHCLQDPTGSLLKAGGWPGQLDRDGPGAEWSA